jgi:hypothetical protein
MIFLGKLLDINDLKIFFSVNDVIEESNKDVLNSIQGTLNNLNFTLNTFETITHTGEKPFDPYFVSYTIIDQTHSKYETIRQTNNNQVANYYFTQTPGRDETIRQTTNSIPMRHGVGYYWVPIKIDPKLFRIGRYLIQWEYKQYFDSEIQASFEEFDVVRPAAYSGEFCNIVYPNSTRAYQGTRWTHNAYTI